MDDIALSQTLREGLLAGLYCGAPLLLVATGIGFAMAVFQAATQIQDTTLPQVIKMTVIAILLLMFSGPLASPLVTFTVRVFQTGR